MSRKQWGHGYHTGAASKKKSGYVGLWFFTTNDKGMIQYQGQIRRRVSKDSFAVQHHEWMMGEANGSLVVVSLEELKTFQLFETATDLRYSIHEFQMRHPELYPDASSEAFEAWESMLQRMSNQKRAK